MTTFSLNQSNDGFVQLATIKVPGCGRNERDDAPVIVIEIEKGEIVMKVWADILSTEPSHVIPLNGALLSKKVAHEASDPAG
jgi:hypothetical protein